MSYRFLAYVAIVSGLVGVVSGFMAGHWYQAIVPMGVIVTMVALLLSKAADL